MADDNTCEHPPCTCAVPDGSDSDYCSPYCETAGEEITGIACDCHHPGCGAAMA
jgi:hypothetical protein